MKNLSQSLTLSLCPLLSRSWLLGSVWLGKVSQGSGVKQGRAEQHELEGRSHLPEFLSFHCFLLYRLLYPHWNVSSMWAEAHLSFLSLNSIEDFF